MPSVLRTFVLGGVLGVGIVSGGALAVAQTSPDTAPAPAESPGTTAGTTPGTTTPDAPAPAPDDGAGKTDGHARRHGHGPHAKGERGPQGKDGHARMQATDEALATELGVTVDQLRDARKAAREAVEAMGPLTKPANRPPTDEEKATRSAELKARADTFNRTLADKLGVTTDRLRDARIAVVAKRLDEAVAAGKLTREQADERLAKLREGAAEGVDGFGPGHGGFGHGFGPGRHGHGGPEQQDEPGS